MGSETIWLSGGIKQCVGKDDYAGTDFLVYKVTVVEGLGRKQDRWVREDQLSKL